MFENILSKPETKKPVEEKGRTGILAVVEKAADKKPDDKKPLIVNNIVDQEKQKYKKLINSVLIFLAFISFTVLSFLIGNIVNGGLLVAGITLVEISPIVLLVIFLLALGVGGFVFSLMAIAVWRWKSPESFFFLMLRLTGAILVRIHYFNGREVWLRGRIGAEGITIEANGKVVCIDPKQLGDGDNSYCYGIEIIDVAANNMIAVGIIKTLGIFTVEEWYHDPNNKYVVLPYYDDAIVMTLYGLPESDLAEHCSLWVNYDASTITWDDMVRYNLFIEPRKPEESDEVFTARCQTSYDAIFAPKQDETEEAFRARMQPYFNKVKDIQLNDEVDKLKKEIQRLKAETRGRILTSKVFTYHAAMKALDPRLHYEAYGRLNDIKEAEKEPKKPGTPDWVKAVGVLIGIGIAGLAICAGIYLVIKAVTP
jgi:hypothetical protein